MAAATTSGTDGIPSGNFSTTDGNLASARAPDVVVCFQCREHTVDDDVSAGMCEDCYIRFIEHRCGGCGRRLAEVPLALQSPTRGSTRTWLQTSATQPPVFARDGGDGGDSDGDGPLPIMPIQRSVSSADGASRKSAIAELIPVPRRGSDSLLDEDEPAGGSSAILPARTPSRSTRVPVRASKGKGKGRASLRRQLTVGLAGATFTPPLSSPRNICAMAVAEVASPLSQPIGADTVEAFDRKWHRHCLRLFHPGHNVDVATLSSPAHKTPVAVLASSASTARKALFGAKGDSVDPLAAQLGASRTYVFYPSSDDDDDEEAAAARRSPEPKQHAVDDASTGAGGAGAGVGHSSSRAEATPPHLPPHSRRISAPVVTHASLAALVSPPHSRRHSASVTSIQSMSSLRSVERARKAVAAQHPAKQLRRRSRRRSSVFFTRNAKQLIQRIKVMGLVADRTYRFREYASCLVGSELVDYLVSSAQCSTRSTAVAVGRKLEAKGYLKHVTGDHEFTDGSFFYRLFEHPGRTTQRRPRRRSSVTANTAAMRAPAADVGVKLGTVPEPDDPVGVDRPGVHIAYDKLPEWARGKDVEELLELTIKSGWMVKQGHKIKNWRRRWFVLRGFQLKYYKAEQGADSSKKVQGLIDVRDFNAQRATIAKSKLALRLVSRQSANQDYLLYAESVTEYEQWFKVLGEAIFVYSHLDVPC